MHVHMVAEQGFGEQLASAVGGRLAAWRIIARGKQTEKNPGAHEGEASPGRKFARFGALVLKPRVQTKMTMHRRLWSRSSVFIDALLKRRWTCPSRIPRLIVVLIPQQLVSESILEQIVDIPLRPIMEENVSSTVTLL